jgi:hypothetical protein
MRVLRALRQRIINFLSEKGPADKSDLRKLTSEVGYEETDEEYFQKMLEASLSEEPDWYNCLIPSDVEIFSSKGKFPDKVETHVKECRNCRFLLSLNLRNGYSANGVTKFSQEFLSYLRTLVPENERFPEQCT